MGKTADAWGRGGSDSGEGWQAGLAGQRQQRGEGGVQEARGVGRGAGGLRPKAERKLLFFFVKQKFSTILSTKF